MPTVASAIRCRKSFFVIQHAVGLIKSDSKTSTQLCDTSCASRRTRASRSAALSAGDKLHLRNETRSSKLISPIRRPKMLFDATVFSARPNAMSFVVGLRSSKSVCKQRL